MSKNMNNSKRVAVVVSKQQKKVVLSKPQKNKKQNKQRRDNTFEVYQAPVAYGIVSKTDNRNHIFHVPPRREFLGKVLGSTLQFQITKSLIVNPGDPQTFPWLNGMAALYESYRFRKLKFIYVPRCGSTEKGTLAISPDCNPHDAAPNSDVEAFQNEKTKSCSPWQGLNMDFNSEMLNKRKTYFNRPLPTGADKDFYDVANVHVIVGSNSADGVLLGELWIEYEVDFFTPESKPVFTPTFQLKSTNPASATSPLGTYVLNGVPDVNVVSNQVGDIVRSIVTDGTGSLLTFNKDFHGELSANTTGTSIVTQALGLTAMTNSFGTPTINMSELGISMNQNIANSAGTLSMISNLVQAKAGQAIRVFLNSGNLNPGNVQLSLDSCGL